MVEDVKNALKEGRLRFYKNGAYSYKPSKEYMDKFKGQQQESMIKIMKDSVNKMKFIDRAFNYADKRNKKVSHITNGKAYFV